MLPMGDAARRGARPPRRRCHPASVRVYHLAAGDRQMVRLVMRAGRQDADEAEPADVLGLLPDT